MVAFLQATRQRALERTLVLSVVNADGHPHITLERDVGIEAEELLVVGVSLLVHPPGKQRQLLWRPDDVGVVFASAASAEIGGTMVVPRLTGEAFNLGVCPCVDA